MSKSKLLYNTVSNTPTAIFKIIALKRTIFTILAVIGSLYAASAPSLAQETKKILAFGDSLFTTERLEDGDSFPEQLESKLIEYGQPVEVIAAGFDGYTSQDAVEIVDNVLNENPDIDMVIFIFGGNDYFQQIPTDITRRNMDQMLAEITGRGIPTLMAGLIIPYNGYLGFSDRLNSVYTDLSAKYPVTLDPFFLEGVAGVRELNQADGIHPNKFGNQVIATRVSGIVSEMLGEMYKFDRVQALLTSIDSTLENVEEEVDEPLPQTTAITTSAATTSEKHILIVGDSLVAGLGLAPELSFPSQLEAKLQELNPNITVHNAGVSGDTSTGGASRLEWVLASHEELDLVVVLFGGNDALRGIHHELTRRSMDKMVELLKTKNIKTLVAGMVAPPNMGQVYGDNFNSIYPDVAKKYDAALYPFFLDGVAGVLELNQNDRIHPNQEGVAYIVERIYPMIYDLVNSD